jgi:hypothetical protein
MGKNCAPCIRVLPICTFSIFFGTNSCYNKYCYNFWQSKWVHCPLDVTQGIMAWKLTWSCTLQPKSNCLLRIPFWGNPNDVNHELSNKVSNDICILLPTKVTCVFFMSKTPSKQELSDPNIPKSKLTTRRDLNPLQFNLLSEVVTKTNTDDLLSTH